MRRTVRLLLRTTTEQASALAETARQFTGAVNLVAARGWAERCKNGVSLHHATYREGRTAFPGLIADLYIQARVRATEAVKSALALAKAGRTVSAPRSAFCPPRYNAHTFKLDWNAGTVRLSAVDGRMTVPFHLPGYAAPYAGAEVDAADLCLRDGRWWLHVVVTLPAPEVEPTGMVIGVDLGLAWPAVTSTGKFLGERRWRDIEHRRFKLRRALQKAGTKPAKRHLKKIRRKQRLFRRDCDHVLSKCIVANVAPGDVIVLENLRDIRSRARAKRGAGNRRLHGWSFAQLKTFIAYKAEAVGCRMAGVDPRHTSQRCSSCGHTVRNNRRSRGLFRCRACGYELNADLNGACNVAAKYRAGGGTSEPGGQPVNLPIVGMPCPHGVTHKLSPSGDSR